MSIFKVFDTVKGDTILPIMTKAGAPVDGTSGSFAGVAEKGALLLDTTNGTLYQNTGTKASPVWSLFAKTGEALMGSSLKVGSGTKTAAATAGAATLNKPAGVITSEALTTEADAEYELTLTNSEIAAADQVFASVQNGTNTQGVPYVTRVTPAAGNVKIRVRNGHASEALNGTLKIAFFVLKN
jgi:hypothetical protein